MVLRGVLSKNLRRLRKERGWSQETLADKVDIDRTYVSLLERQKYAATIDIIEKLARAFSIDPLELLSDERSKSL